MPYRRRGYRKRWSTPKKGLKPWQRSWSTKKHPVPQHTITSDRHDLIEDIPQVPTPFLGFSESEMKPAIRVLSLFDGLSTPLLILDRLGIQVEAYFSSEIDERYILLQKYNFGSRITAVGSVRMLGPRHLSDMGKIDLLIGGSPCSDISLVNPRRRGLHDKDSTGRLFYSYVRIYKYLRQKALTQGYPFWWLFENTSHLEKKVCEEMSRCLECEPVRMCASEFLPVIRRRNFWGNIPHLNNGGTPLSTEAKELNDVLMPYRDANVRIVPTLTTTQHSQCSGRNKILPVLEEGKASPLFITELESLFGFPPHFTDGPNISLTDRRRMLGKSFCVPVVQHILLPLQSNFSNTSQSQQGQAPLG